MLNKICRKGLGIAATIGTAALLASFALPDGIYGDYQQGLRGFEYLKKVRKSPNDYTERLKVSLKGIDAGPELRYNDTLAAVAEERAMDMAKNDYYGHTDKSGYGANYYINKAGFKLDTAYLKNKKADNFEVIMCDHQSGEQAVAAMIQDDKDGSLAGRKLLLAMTDFSKGLTDVGIGFVHGTKDTKYRYYTVLLIAKRKK